MRRYYRDSRIQDLVDGNRIRITGTVLEAGKDSFVIDDGTGLARVWVDEVPNFVRESNLVQVLGLVVKQGNEIVIKSDIVRDVHGLNIGAYKKLMDWV